LERFRQLPVAEVEAALSAILDAHLAIVAAGLVAVDLYDGCFLYDFDRSKMWLVDLDEYRPGPFTLEEERLPGSERYMAPEEWVRGSTIDERTTVYVLGRVLHHLLDSEQGWRGRESQRKVVNRATASDPAERYQDVDVLVAAWQAS
jgi:serine/threonine-protein kinase